MIEKEPLKTNKTEISKEAMSANNEKDSQKSRTKKVGSIPVGETISNPMEYYQRKDMIEDAFVGYAEYISFKDDLDCWMDEYISRDDVEIMKNIRLDKNASQKDKNEALIRLHDDITERADKKSLPNDTGNTKLLRTILKIEYAMNCNEAMKNVILRQSKEEMVTLHSIRESLNATYVNISSEGKQNRYRKLGLEERFSNKQGVIDNMMGSLEGMRHEVGFKQLFSNLDFMSIIPAYSKEDDMKGVDMRLNVKVSKNRDNNGRLKVANKLEINNGFFENYVLPIDIKSTQANARETNDKNQKYTIDYWAMWSQIDKMDFCISLDSDGKTLSYCCRHMDADYAPIFFNKKQIAAISKFGGREIGYSNLLHSDFTKSNELKDSKAETSNEHRHFLKGDRKYYIIYSYEDRVKMLTRDINEGLNKVYPTRKEDAIYPLAK